jgi:hypothetical protein
MPRFFFDTYDGDTFIADTEGLELPDLAAAKREAQAGLPHMAKDALPDGDRKEFIVTVRNENGHPILRAVLSLRVEAMSVAQA